MAERRKLTAEEKIREKEEKLQREQERLAQIQRQAEEAIQKSTQAIKIYKNQLRKEQEKKREHYKIWRGGLVDIAGLLFINPNVLLGALLTDILPVVAGNDTVKISEWEKAGEHYHDTYTYKSKERAEIQKSNEQSVQAAIEQNYALKDKLVR